MRQPGAVSDSISPVNLTTLDTGDGTINMAGCELSPAASAFSAILSAVVGSVINGVTNGWLVAFMTGWIAWLAIMRVLIGGLYLFWRSITDSWGPGQSKDFVDPTPPPLHTYYPMTNTGYAGYAIEYPSNLPLTDTYQQQSEHAAYPNGWIAVRRGVQVVLVPKPNLGRLATNIWPSAAVVRGLDLAHPQSIWTFMHPRPGTINSLFTPRADLDRNVTVLGWVGVVYTALFAPITQILFLAAHLGRHDDGAAKIVKGLTVAVTALPLCIDCRVRYADSLSFGRWMFNMVVSTSCLLQGGICATLLIIGLLDLNSSSRNKSRPNERSRSSGPPTAVIVIVYLVFSLIWMAMSFVMLPMRDGGRKGAGKRHWAGYILDLWIGILAGVFLAAPAIALYSGANFGRKDEGNGVSDLAAYLKCETVPVWRKFSAVIP